MGEPSYQPLGPLMAGGGSRAVLGLQVQDGAARPVVLVWVPEPLAKDPAAVAAVERETARAAVLDHPNIVLVHGLARTTEGVARVVEYADGESLRKVLETAGPLPVPLAALVAADAAKGLHFAHVAGNDDGTPMVHGDLRPETIIVSFKGVAKVAGYGALSVAPREPAGQRLPGRRTHIAPEQLIGGRETVIVQTDVYLAGVVLYECLTGEHLFRASSDFDQAVLSAPITPRDEIPKPLFDVIQRACAKRAADRYPSALAFREAVEAAVGQLPPHEDLAAYMTSKLPGAADLRASRQRTIDKGIAEFAQRQWAEDARRRSTGESLQVAAAARSGPAPAKPAPPAAPKPAAAPSAPASKPAPPARAPVHIPEAPVVRERPAARPSLAPFIVVGSLAIAAVAIFFAVTARQQAAELRGAVSAKGGVPTNVIVDAPDASELLAPPLTDGDAGEAAVVGDGGGLAVDADGGASLVASADAGAPLDAGLAVEPPDAGPTGFSIYVEPTVEVFLDGGSLGRTPVTVDLPPGRYVVKLLEKRKFVNLTRFVTVRETGRTNERIFLRHGFVTVTAPASSKILIDGQHAGDGPTLVDFPIYEGAHRVEVKVAGSVWQQFFSLKADERMNFDVDFE